MRKKEEEKEEKITFEVAVLVAGGTGVDAVRVDELLSPALFLRAAGVHARPQVEDADGRELDQRADRLRHELIRRHLHLRLLPRDRLK